MSYLSLSVCEHNETRVWFACVYPGEQSPVGATSPEERQYLPGGQSSQPDLLNNPICLLKVPAGHGNAIPDCVPVDKQCLTSTDGSELNITEQFVKTILILIILCNSNLHNWNSNCNSYLFGNTHITLFNNISHAMQHIIS